MWCFLRVCVFCNSQLGNNTLTSPTCACVCRCVGASCSRTRITRLRVVQTQAQRETMMGRGKWRVMTPEQSRSLVEMTFKHGRNTLCSSQVLERKKTQLFFPCSLSLLRRNSPPAATQCPTWFINKVSWVHFMSHLSFAAALWSHKY